MFDWRFERGLRRGRSLSTQIHAANTARSKQTRSTALRRAPYWVAEISAFFPSFQNHEQQQVLASKLNVHACVLVVSVRCTCKKEVVKRMGERRLLRKRKGNVPPQQTFRTFPRHSMLGVTVCVRCCDNGWRRTHWLLQGLLRNAGTTQCA